MTAKRLASGGRIDRDQSIAFTWCGKTLHGFGGDTLASALLANHVQIIGRSFKYHRPRGVMSAGVDESGALLTVGEGARRDPNVKATQQELYADLCATAQNAWPSVNFDIGAIANLFARFLPAGFYYKTFMGPRIVGNRGTAMWMQFEKLIRRAAGMGEASRLPDHDRYEHGHDFCDVLVVGGGIAGMTAAATAARAGLDVMLVEQDYELGGELLNQAATEKCAALCAEVESAKVRCMPRTTAFGLYDGGVVGAVERVTEHLPDPDPRLPRQRFWTLRARHIIIAAGAIERHFAFGNNDRPGVMSVSAARAYCNRYAVLVGENIVIAANNDSAYPAAAELARVGAKVVLLDARDAVDEKLRESVETHGVTLRMRTAPHSVIGKRCVKLVRTAIDDGGWTLADRLPCDGVLVSGGWSPTIHLQSHRGAKPVWDKELACFLAPATAEPLTTVGSAAGIWDTDACEMSGRVAGEAIAESLKNSRGKKVPKQNSNHAMPKPGGWRNPIRPLYEVQVAGKKSKAWVDMQNDVTADDVRLAHREGFVSVEHLKRYTTLGMATDGGKVGNVVGLALMAAAARSDIAAVGATVFRPPYTPIALGALRGQSVGEHFRPTRRTPMHRWNLDHGAVMTMAGLWHRPWYFPTRDKTMREESLSQAYIREAATVREAVGLCDVTSLGKIAVQGPDAAAFLDCIYTNPFAKLPIGKARYGIMLRDDGIVMDDGTTWRLGADDYFMTTTTAHAGKVMAWLEELLQTRMPKLKVHVTSVSEQWAGCAIAGPKSRAVLAACMKKSSAVADAQLPFMGVVETEFKGGIPCRIARISFSGEMAFEVYVPSDFADTMMEMLWAAAKPLGGCLYGLEALGALRIEKGHVTGAELDGRVTIDDVGLGKMASANKAFIGGALRKRAELMRDDRPQLVGITPKNRAHRFNAGAILCAPDNAKKLEGGLGDGWISAVTHSPALGHWIGLGFIKGGHRAWQGKSAVAADPVRTDDNKNGGITEVEITTPHRYDPSGERMRG